ncbi:MAG: toxin-antitoxin system YwqK family antitoxin [Gemmatimonadales bacterium]
MTLPPDRTDSRVAGSRSSPRVGIVAAYALLLVAAGCGEPPARPKSELLRQGSLYLDPVTLEPYSGAVFTTFAGSPPRIEQRASLRDGHYDGPFEWYFGKGQLALRELYRDGQKDGPYEWYFESGRLYERGTYVNGRLEGPYEAYYESGDLYEKGTYRAGAFHGPREWYLDGRLIELVTYADGRISGPYERYSETGELDSSGVLLDGLPCGDWLEGATRILHPPCVESE